MEQIAEIVRSIARYSGQDEDDDITAGESDVRVNESGHENV